jgi:hypothetical protein
MGQLKTDITALFSDTNLITQLYAEALDKMLAQDVTQIEDVEADIQNVLSTTVKEAYEMIPEITYPLVTIKEIDNTTTKQYWNGTEFATSLAYQFTINCEQSVAHNANQNVKILQYIIDKYLQGERYYCLRRIAFSSPISSVDDPNIRTGMLRYDCNLVPEQNTIYRRY